MDCQLGMVNTHSMVGASGDYLHRYINVLPKTFNPKQFDAEWYVRLAKVAGITYVTFTDEELREKFLRWAATRIDEAQAWRIIELTGRLEELEDVGELVGLLAA